jgi:hypothetical protein
MKTKITISVDARLLCEIRALATRQGTSVSSLLATHLRQIVDERKTYLRSRKRALVRLRRGFDLGWTPGLRGELHEHRQHPPFRKERQRMGYPTLLYGQ